MEVLKNMRYSTKQYARALVELINENKTKDLNKIFKDFSNMLSKNADTVLKNDILYFTAKYLDEKENNLRIEVTTSEKMDVKLPKEIQGKKVIKENKVDPSILGGVKIKIGDILIDNSVKNRLDLLQEAIA